MSLDILDNGLHLDSGTLRYAWYRLRTATGERWRAVALKELRYVTVEERADPDVYSKQWAAMRGLYNARVDAVYLAAGIFEPRHVGVVQYYGAAAEANTEDDAARSAQEQLGAVEATLANFPQAKLGECDLWRLAWLFEFLNSAPHVLALLGHPDPRQAKRGLGREGSLGDTDDDLASQQNEMLFRGLARLRENFVFQVVTERIGRKRLANTLTHIAQHASLAASRQRGSTSIGFSLGLPILAAIAQGHAGQQSGGQSEAHGVSDGVSHSASQGHTASWSRSSGGSESWGEGTSHTESQATTNSHSVSVGETQSQAHTDSHSVSDGVSSSVGGGSSWSHSTGSSWSQGSTVNVGVGHGTSSSTTEGTSATNSASESQGWNVGANASVNAGIDLEPGFAGTQLGSMKAGGSLGVSGGVSGSTTEGESTGVNSSVSEGHSSNISASIGHSSSVGGSSSSSVGGSSSWSQGTSHTETSGTADTVGTATSRVETTGTATTVGSADSVSQSHAVSRSWSSSVGGANSQQEGWGTAHGESYTQGSSVARGASQSQSGGFSMGLAPGVNIGQSWQTEDDVAGRVTEVLRGLEGVANQASAEGGFMTDARLLLASSLGARAGASLAPQAFHGPQVPTPVLTVALSETDAPIIRAHALAFRPCDSPAQAADPLDGLLWRKYSTLLSAGQVAAYTAPGLFEEGAATTVQEALPPLGFYPDLPGEVLVGHQYSPETGDLTKAPVRLSRDRHFHTAFCGDTGFGKSVAAIRLAYETTLNWKLRTVVLDFGAGWRQLLNAPGLTGHVAIYQLWPGAASPFRWNPLQIGRNIEPETQWRAFADIFGAVAQLGQKRQVHELREALRMVYVRSGVLVDDPDVRSDPEWGYVGATEAPHANAPVGTSLAVLSRASRQALAVLRSRQVGLSDLYAQIQAKWETVPPRDTTGRGILEGMLYRLNPLVQGAAAMQYAPGPESLPIEDLSQPWGITILEGGAFLDEFSKAFLLGWAAWHLYTDAVVRRIRRAAPPDEYLQIVFEEANKILAGVSSGSEDEGSGSAHTAEQFAAMWRDSRKYGMWLHLITQSPALIPPGILSSCNNIVIGQLKTPKDRDLVTAHLARSEKGLVDERWRRFLANLAIGQAVCRLGYTRDRAGLEPMLMYPLLLPAPEPSDEEIERLQRR